MAQMETEQTEERMVTKMAEYIDRQALLEKMKNWHEKTSLVSCVHSIPAADVVEVVRCKDCKWFNKIGCAITIVDDSDKPKENDYCSFAERKGEAECEQG